jgi:ribosomal protein S18 acetylase RimI-like enzyme
MIHRFAGSEDCALLSELNLQLIQDEGHRNPMSFSELYNRMSGWLCQGYCAVLFEEEGELAGYALYREERTGIYLRHLFVVRDRRRRGLGREMIGILKRDIWPGDKRLTVEVLVSNEPAMRFWRSVGFNDYSLTLEILPPPKSV